VSECWAAPLGDCAGKISREHIVTRGVFENDETSVQGFPWCPEPTKISLSGFTAKILCEKHNSALSTADDAGIATIKQFREFLRLAQVRGAMKPRRWRIKRFGTNGYELERWFLKTLTNIAFGRRYPVFKPQGDEWRPSKELVEVAFGLRRFEPRAGLYLMGGQPGEKVSAYEGLRIITFTDKAERLVGARFLVFGFVFVIYLETEGLNRYIEMFDKDGKVTPGINMMYHPRAIRYALPEPHLSHTLQINWN
jgi:hypothetical protein